MSRIAKALTASVLALGLLRPLHAFLPSEPEDGADEKAQEREALPSLDELLGAEEVFICSSNKEVLPVVKVDKAVIGDGKPGRHTAAVMAMFAEYTQSWASGTTP